MVVPLEMFCWGLRGNINEHFEGINRKTRGKTGWIEIDWILSTAEKKCKFCLILRAFPVPFKKFPIFPGISHVILPNFMNWRLSPEFLMHFEISWVENKFQFSFQPINFIWLRFLNFMHYCIITACVAFFLRFFADLFSNCIMTLS